MKDVIELSGLTKDYGSGRGIFDVTLSVCEGETMGFVGTNGSGKTTTIRNFLGFVKPTSGSAKVYGKTSWNHSSEIADKVGYVPGEIAFPDLKTGIDFLKCQADFKGLGDLSYANTLIERLQLDPRANLKRMSKGMKQKTALVAALMFDSPLLVLDEPTTGLDPLMRVSFLDILRDEQKKGKTIFMSSHLFEELEGTCDRVALIRDGYIVDIADMNAIRNRPVKEFKVEFKNHDDFVKFGGLGYEIIRVQEQYNQYTVKIKSEDGGKLISSLVGYDVKFISELPYTLERHFKEILKEKESKKDVQ